MEKERKKKRRGKGVGADVVNGKGDRDRTSDFKKYWEADYWKGKK